MRNIFDSHAHYDDSQFDGDREELLGQVLPEKGVSGVINMAADLASCQTTWVFGLQLELAKELSLPVVVHDREAHADTLAFLQRYRPAGVVHCFSGSWETAREILDLGMYIGLGGVVTFKNARHPVEVAKNIPLDRLLLETDCPYMAPVPFRGKRNDSSLIAYVAERIGEVRGQPAEEILQAAEANARRLFAIDPN